MIRVSTSSVIQNAGTVAILALAFAMTNIALHGLRYQRYGREALLCSAAFLMSQAIIRTLSINGAITTYTARALVTIAAFTAVAILAQLVWVRRLENGQ